LLPTERDKPRDEVGVEGGDDLGSVGVELSARRFGRRVSYVAKGDWLLERAFECAWHSNQDGGMGGRENGGVALVDCEAVAIEGDELGGVRVGGGKRVSIACDVLE
jgi:hypothetical protein